MSFKSFSDSKIASSNDKPNATATAKPAADQIVSKTDKKQDDTTPAPKS